MAELIAGGNAGVPTSTLIIRVRSGVAADVAAFRLYENGRTRADDDFVFYGQKQTNDRSILLLTEGTNTSFSVNLGMLNPAVEKVAFTITVDSGTVKSLGSVKIAVEESGMEIISGNVEMASRNEAALILGELYKRNGDWKFRFISQGFNGGLQPLAEHYGVDISDSPEPPPPPVRQPTPSPAPQPSSSINLSKVTLTKERPTINLQKSVNLSKAEGFGRIRVNLNWNKRTSGGGGFFSRSKEIDLDLGAYIRMKDGEQTLIQALGGNFGNYLRFPFMQLENDDRSGASTDGEWLNINGSVWDDISEVVIFSFIYEGVPNWNETDGVVTLYLPEQPPVETRLTEGNNRMMMCAIARLRNVNNTIQIERLDEYFDGHRKMDQAYGWGFRWTAGSK